MVSNASALPPCPLLVRLTLVFASSYSPICDSYVRPAELVRICDECNFGTYGGRCIVCGGHGESCIVVSVR